MKKTSPTRRTAGVPESTKPGCGMFCGAAKTLASSTRKKIMTTIAAIQGDGFAVLGSDSRITSDGGRIYLLPKEIGKIVRNEKYLLAASGDLRAINLLANVKLPSTGGVSGKKLDRFISTEVVPLIQEEFERNGYGKEGSQESEVMLCVEGVIYEIAQNYDLSRDSTGIYGVGSGSSYAVGALHAMVDRGVTVDEAKEYIREAIKIAVKLDAGTGEPINIVVQYSEKN
jgi:ATP-dependent protease HslVU (ClpYQ) peptidase subunit